MKQDFSSGAERRRAIQGSRADELHDYVASLDPDIADWSDGFIFDGVWGRPGLDIETRMLVAISFLTASNKIPPLRAYLRGALEYGVKTRKIQEALVMSQVYCGFPTMLAALTAWKEILSENNRSLDDDAET